MLTLLGHFLEHSNDMQKSAAHTENEWKIRMKCKINIINNNRIDKRNIASGANIQAWAWLCFSYVFNGHDATSDLSGLCTVQTAFANRISIVLLLGLCQNAGREADAAGNDFFCALSPERNRETLVSANLTVFSHCKYILCRRRRCCYSLLLLLLLKQ